MRSEKRSTVLSSTCEIHAMNLALARLLSGRESGVMLLARFAHGDGF